MKQNEFISEKMVSEGIMDNLASFAKGATGYSRPKRDLLVNDFITSISSKLKTGIQTGAIAAPGASAGAMGQMTTQLGGKAPPTISKWLVDAVSKYMGAGADSPAVAISTTAQAQINQLCKAVEDSYTQDQGKQSIAKLATSLSTLARQSAATQNAAPSAIQQASTPSPQGQTFKAKPNNPNITGVATPTPATPTPATPTGPVTSVVTSTPDQVRKTKLATNAAAAQANMNRPVAAPANVRATPAERAAALAAARAKRTVTPESKQKIVKKWGEE